MTTDSTRKRILDAAGPIFAENGYQASTVRDICDQADVNLAAVNYYFGDKERLYLETVKLARQNRAEEAPLPDWGEDTPTETKLRDFVRTMTTRMLVASTSVRVSSLSAMGLKIRNARMAPYKVVSSATAMEGPMLDGSSRVCSI